jgi:sialidase-1
VILLTTWNKGTDTEAMIIDGTSEDTRRIYRLISDDEGQHWSSPTEITAEVKKPEWTWYATGPVNGIQLDNPAYPGRLLIPCDHIEAGTRKYYSHVIYSDDGGINWMLGGSTPSDGVNESTIAELPGGDLLLNMRNYTGARLRQVSRSSDGGVTWTLPESDPFLPEPVCQASLLAFVNKRGQSLLAFSNPADAESRVRMTVRISRDNGKSWRRSQVLHTGPSAYSNLILLPNGNLGCLFEGGKESPYEGIVFQELLFKDFR